MGWSYVRMKDESYALMTNSMYTDYVQISANKTSAPHRVHFIKESRSRKSDQPTLPCILFGPCDCQ